LEVIMKINTPLHAEHQLDQVAGQFEHWRRTRTHARDRIPQALWDQAVALARVMPHSRVAQHLRLSANDLKKQMAMPSQETTAMPPLPLSFVEVPSAPAWPQPSGATQVELRRVDGTRLCIHSVESTLPLEALVRAFLEVR
jgi:crotonobetainyl-CoA:carnitine CoA-transferase CaiB-like acyl-CoA transferase